MKKILVLLIAAFALTGCSSWQGQVGKTVDSFTDDHGRACTSVKWGDSASVDCDFPNG